MLQTLLRSEFPDIKHGILKHLDTNSKLQCRLVSKWTKRLIDEQFAFVAVISDYRIRNAKFRRDTEESYWLQGIRITKLQVGKFTNTSRKNWPTLPWKFVQEISFTRAITSENYTQLLKLCTNVKVVRMNHMALGGPKITGSIFPRWKIFRKRERNQEYYLPLLKQIKLDRINSKEYTLFRSSYDYGDFDGELYFKRIWNLISQLEKDILGQTEHDWIEPEVGLCFTKPDQESMVFPMSTEKLNFYTRKLCGLQ